MITDLSKLGALGGVALDWLLSGGDLVLGIIGAVVEVLLGQPELVVGLVSAANRLATRVPYLSEPMLDQILTVVLTAWVALYVLRLANIISTNARES